MRPELATLLALVSGAAAARPDRVAVAALEGPELSYAALEDSMASAGAALRSLRVGRGDRVAIALEHGPPALAQAFLGVASHAVAAPLDPASPPPELERALRNLEPRVLVAESSGSSLAAEVARGAGIRVVDALALAETPATGCSGQATQPDDVALILSTSGTTSQPKLVPLTHANLCASAANVARHLQLTDTDRCLSVMPLFHIHGLVAGLLAPLAAGGTVIRTPPFDAQSMLSWLDELGPTWYTAVPAMHQALLTVAGTTPRRTSLRLIRSSSAPLPARLSAELERVFGVPVIESYGMTEAAHQIASNPLPPGMRKPGSVGRPAGPEVAIVGGDGRQLPPGNRGEIVIRGANVTSGYAGDPAASAAAFTPDGWLRTGDEGILDEDGYLRICGRLKEVINRGGETVSPLEIDEVLLDHPAVQHAVTFAVSHPRLGEDVAAAIVVRPGASVTASELRMFAASRLAPSKIPHRVLLVDRLPDGPTGKFQRIGLAAALGLTSSGRTTRRPAACSPRTPLEAELAGRWAAVLEVGEVGLNEDFFELGGDSLAAAELLAFVDEAYGVEMPLGAVLGEASTVAGMADLVESHRAWPRAETANVPELESLHLHGTGALSPLFVIDPTLALLRRLAEAAGADQPIAELTMPSSGDFGSLTRVERMAAHYAAVIRAAQPEGPYFLSGHSFAGLVAFDVARQLRARGQAIGLLLMLDTVCPYVRYLEPSLPMRLHLRRAWRLGRGGRAYLRSVREDRRAGLVPQEPRVLMAARYAPRRLTVPVALLHTRPNVEANGDPALGWDEFVPRLELHAVSGDHRSMLQEPHARELAAAMASCVSRARANLAAQGAAGGLPSSSRR